MRWVRISEGAAKRASAFALYGAAIAMKRPRALSRAELSAVRCCSVCAAL